MSEKSLEFDYKFILRNSGDTRIFSLRQFHKIQLIWLAMKETPRRRASCRTMRGSNIRTPRCPAKVADSWRVVVDIFAYLRRRPLSSRRGVLVFAEEERGGTSRAGFTWSAGQSLYVQSDSKSTREMIKINVSLRIVLSRNSRIHREINFALQLKIFTQQFGGFTLWGWKVT